MYKFQLLAYVDSRLKKVQGEAYEELSYVRKLLTQEPKQKRLLVVFHHTVGATSKIGHFVGNFIFEEIDEQAMDTIIRTVECIHPDYYNIGLVNIINLENL